MTPATFAAEGGECATFRARKMPLIQILHRRLLVVFFTLNLMTLSGLQAGEMASKISQAFIERLIAEKSPSQQDKIIQAEGVTAAALRTELLANAYQLTLNGDYRRAESLDNLALRLAAAAGDGGDVAAANVQSAFLSREAGDLASALSSINKAVNYYEMNPGTKHGLISAHQALGIIYLYQSDFARALKSFNRALSLSEEIKYREGVIPALNSIGEVYRTQGQPERAIEYYERARKVVADDQAWNMAFIFNNLGMSYDAMGELDRAVANIEKARAVAERVKFEPRVMTSLAILGDLELKREHLPGAEKYYLASVKLARQLHDGWGEARALQGIARIALVRGEYLDALTQAQSAVTLCRKFAGSSELVPALTLEGRCLQKLGRNDEARQSFEESIAKVEEMRGQVAGGDVEREAFLAQEIAPFHELIRAFVSQGQPEQALAVSERASARVLLDLTSRARVEMSSILTEEEQTRQRALELKLADANRELHRFQTKATVDPAEVRKGEEAVHEARQGLDDFEAILNSDHPELRRITPPQPIGSLSEIASLVEGHKCAVLRFVVTDEEAFLFLLTKPNESKTPQVKALSLGRTRAGLARLVKDFRSRLAARSLSWETPARELYELLLQPIESQLNGIESLVIIPDGPLWELPFQALERSTDEPVLDSYAVRYAPSLAFLRNASGSLSGHAERQLLGFVNPAVGKEQEDTQPTRVALMDQAWRPLPETEKQATELQRIYPPPTGAIYTGREARESVFKKEASSADILHFAMHGVLDDRAPLYSYLLFSQVNVAPAEDGRLEARELMKLRFSARLAVLCGCETARGQVTAGEGVIGLSWGFMVAGCPATIVSQWKVDSASSTPLMVELHRRLHSGTGHAEALRQASLELRKDERYRHPFYWAPFVLIGSDS